MNPTVERATSALHRRYVLTPWAAQGALSPPAIERAEGVFLYDEAGRRYLDLVAGLVAVNLGHGHPAVVRAMAEQAQRLCYAAPSFFNGSRARLGERLSALSPWNEGCRTFFGTGGGEANEDAMKIARTVTGRPKILSAFRSFHGSGPGAGSLTGENRRWPNEPGLPGIVHFFAPYPYRSPFHTTDPVTECERALAHLELTLTYEDPKRIAAILVEPVVGSNGVIIYPDGYLAGLRALCDRHGILLIFDEVMTGFGRVGDAFASLRFSVVPDIITIAKGCTSAYVPLGGVMVRESIAAYFDDTPLVCGHTYSGHPLAVATALAVLQAYDDEGLFARAREIEGWLQSGLTAVAQSSPLIGEVRGLGAMFAIELVKDRASREPLVAWQGASNALVMPKLLARLRDLGVHAFGRYNVLLITPPLTIMREEIALGMEALETALSELPSTP
jgi:taurine--2-oxoglutarate transaminase